MFCKASVLKCPGLKKKGSLYFYYFLKYQSMKIRNAFEKKYKTHPSSLNI